MIGDVAVGVAGNVDHARFVRSDGDGVAVLNFRVDRAQLRDLGGRDDLGAGRLRHRLVSAGMVGMPVGVPDLRDRPSLGISLFETPIAIGRIDRDRFAAVGIVEEKSVIVGQAEELVDLEHGTNLGSRAGQEKARLRDPQAGLS